MKVLDAPLKSLPILETERLLLRPHKFEDLEDCHNMWCDPLVIQHTIGTPSTKQQSWMRMLRYVGHWHVMGYSYWAIEEKKSSKFIGEIGFADFKRNLDPSIEGIPEAGWALSSHAHGKGFAKESLQAILDWADKVAQFSKTVCIIKTENHNSIQLAQKFGFVEYFRSEKDSLLYFERPQLLYKL